jgi:hypothetical protein
VKKIILYEEPVENNDDLSWWVKFNEKRVAFTSYRAALREAIFLMDYCAFIRLRGETNEGAGIFRIEKGVNPETQEPEQWEVLIDETGPNGLTGLKLEKWS